MIGGGTDDGAANGVYAGLLRGGKRAARAGPDQTKVADQINVLAGVDSVDVK